MKKNLLKRIGAVALAVAVSMTMGTAAFAADSDGQVNGDKGIDSTDNSINIAKQIVFINHEDTTVREPNIKYTYTLTAADPGTTTTVTDKDNISGSVKKGEIGAASNTTATVEFKDTATSGASENGISTESKYATFTFVPGSFPAAGIYRYAIKETTTPAKASVGITEAATYADTRYLDVYVKKNGDALQIYGYVLFEGSETTSIKSSEQSGDVSMKSKGYVNKSTTEGTQEDVDVYKTENLEINKAIEGAMADTTHSFPVTITMTKASGLSDGIKLNYEVSNASLTETGTGYVTMDSALAGTVTQSGKITITGVPYGSTVSLTETNDTPDSYTVKAGTTSGGTDLLAEAIVAASDTSGATTDQSLENKTEIFITNTLDQISPTNVVMRFAPYLFILGAAIVLLVMMRRRKAHNAE